MQTALGHQTLGRASLVCRPSKPFITKAGSRTVRASGQSKQSSAIASAKDHSSTLSVAQQGQTNNWQNAGVAAAGIVLASALLAGPGHAADVVDSTLPMAQLADLSIPGIVGDSPLREGFVSGFLLILFSEIGDKTFFIALLLALRQPKGIVFAGTFGALAVMTVISVLLGQALHQLDELLPASANKLPIDDLLAVALLLWFGIRTIQEAEGADDKAAEEKEEAAEVTESMGGDTVLALVASTFALVFAAEWGDKSFLATIALAAASSPAGVVGGAVTGHGVATGIAVAGGSFLSKYFSERVLQYVGGTLFLVFAAATVVDIFAETAQ